MGLASSALATRLAAGIFVSARGAARRIRWLQCSPVTPGYIAFLICILAIVVRLCRYLRADVFEYDESQLRMAVYGWSYTAPLKPLPFCQTAAPLFVGLSRAVTAVWRANEYGWRLLPFIASVLILPVLYYGVSRLWSRWAAVVTVFLACFHVQLVRYGALFKPYEKDALIAASVLAFAGYYRRHGFGRKTWILVLSFGIVAELLSQTAVISLMALLLFITATRESSFRSRAGQNDALRPERVHVLKWLAACAVVWIAVAAAVFSVMYSAVAQSAYMRDYWSDSYLVLYGSAAAGRWRNAAESLFRSLPGPIKIQAALLLISIYAAWRKKDQALLFLLTAPFAAVVLLALLHRYPVAARLWLFLAPFVMTLMSIGIAGLWQLLAKYASPAVASLVLLVCGGLILIRPANGPFEVTLNALHNLRGLVRSPAPAANARSAVARILNSCDDVYVAARGVPSWFFYTNQLDSQPARTERRYAVILQLFRTGSPGFGDAQPELIHIPDSAEAQKLHLGCRNEIYGLGSGTPARSRTWQFPESRKPVPGWAKNEMDRIAGAPGTSFWLYLGEAGDFEIRPLLDEAVRRNYQVTFMGVPQTQNLYFGYSGLFVYRVQK